MTRTLCRNLLRRRCWLLLTALSLLFGCAQWKATPDLLEKRGLPAASLASEAIVLDVIFWPIPEHLPDTASSTFGSQTDPLDLLWREVDEVAIDAGTRQSLLNNGLRAGRIDHIEQWIDRIGLPEPTDPAEQLMQQASVSSEIAHSRHRIPFRSGQQQDFAVRQTAAGNMSVMIREDDNTIGRSLVQPQFLMAVQARPDNDGRIRVRAWPRIDHGPFKQSFVSKEQAIRVNSRRDSWTLHDLKVDLPLDQNQTLLVAPLSDAFGLGKQLLTALRPDGTQDRVAVLIRIARKPEPALE